MRARIAAAACIGAAILLGKASAARQRVWTISYGKDGYSLDLYETPVWALLVEHVGNVLPCTHPTRDWSFKIGPKRLGTYDDGDPIHNLGGLLMRVCDLHFLPAFRTEKRIHRIVVDRETAAVIAPEWVNDCDDLDI